MIPLNLIEWVAPDYTFAHHFVQLRIYYWLSTYLFFLTIFLSSLRLLKRYGKELSGSALLLILFMNAGMLWRAIVYQRAAITYAHQNFPKEFRDNDTESN